MTFIIGYGASKLLKALKLEGTDKVFIDGNKNFIDYDLFFPPIARCLRRRFAKQDKLMSDIIPTVSEFFFSNAKYQDFLSF